MDYIFNKTSIFIGLLGGIFTRLIGGFDTLSTALLTLMVFDYATGVIKSIINKSLSSQIGYVGILKKV